MNGINGFYLGGLRSQDYGIIMTAPPTIIFAERDVETISVEGMSGDLTRDKGRYKNVTVPYKCAILPKDEETIREAAVYAMELLKPSAAYVRLKNTYHPETFRLARIAGYISVESILEQAGEFTANFNCKPQRFLVDGEYPVEFESPSFIVNPTTEIAKPLIVVYGTGPGNLTVGNATVKIKALEDEITLDSEIENAYRQPGEGAPEKRNSSIYAPEFPELLPGVNAVSWDGGITSVKITPRWWTL